MAVYDLMLKLEGLKALCGGGITDDEISFNLFPSHETADQRSNLSRLKSGIHTLTTEHTSILTEDFNARIRASLLAGRNAPENPTALLRAEDWERPLPEFFGHLAHTLDPLAPNALARAHAGVLAALHGLQKYRERDHALLVARYDPSDADGFRFPETAERVDPLELPPGRLAAGKPMTAALVHTVNDEPARGWLFFIRNPDERQGLSQSHYVWDQDVNQLVFWHQGGPFELSAGYVGVLPGFPTTATRLTGEVTAYLLVEPHNSPAVANLLRVPDPTWDGVSAPPFESVAYLFTCAKRLFQRGNALRHDRGQLPYLPPKLFVRRYKIDAERFSRIAYPAER